ncbi:uncharacterized protein LOC107759157 isoform X2 [Nicotiana tabacum]|uniref:Uncharacterized protein LOC107759157 isoform X2 n=1 Tax=Nicotiana tabacum TaxID=4097 RepID=A0A1S3WYH2_TOBAC
MSTNEDVASRRDEEAKEQRRRDRNLRRRTRYAQMSPERKQSFLLKLQAKRAKSKRRRLNPHSSNTLSLMETGTQSQRQSALTVGDCPLDSEEGHASEATNMPAIIDKGNNMIDCMSIFEVGSTSGTCNAGISSTPTATAHREHLWIHSQNIHAS